MGAQGFYSETGVPQYPYIQKVVPPISGSKKSPLGFPQVEHAFS